MPYTKFISFILLMGLLQIARAHTESHGVIKKEIQISASAAVVDVKQLAKDKGITLFTVINHQKGAQKVGLSLDPTYTIILGKPKVGTPLMQSNRNIALDLPLKVVIYEENSKTFLVLNDSSYLAKRYHLEGAQEFKKITNFMELLKKKLSHN